MCILGTAKPRIFVIFFATCIFAALTYFCLPDDSQPTLANHQKPEICRVTSVNSDATACPRTTITSLETHTCFWDIKVVGASTRETRSLLSPEKDYLKPHELNLFRRLDGCNSTSECQDERVYCIYGPEDPSDALWLREYNNSTKFVVLFKVGLGSLIFFIMAIVCDGSIFDARRNGLANSSASFLFLVALSSLLYILLIPRNYQLSLYGAGPLQSVGFVLLILAIASMLPGVVIIWINVAVLFVFFLGFLLEQLIYIVIGVMHFLGVLSLYQAENALLHLQILYTHDVVEQAEFDRRLVNLSQNFLSRIRMNWYLRRLPRAMEEDALHIVSNVLPEHLYDEVMAESIPYVEFENLDHEEAGEDAEARHPAIPDEGTPLLQENGRNTAT